MNSIPKIRILFTLLMTLLLVSSPILVFAQTNNQESVRTRSFEFDPGWFTELDFDWKGTLAPFNIFGVSVDFSFDFFAGVSTPLSIDITYPEWVYHNDSFSISIAAYGNDKGRAGLYIGGGLKLNLIFLGVEYCLVDTMRELPLNISFTTPIGQTLSTPIINKIELTSLTIPIVDYSIKTFLGGECSFVLESVMNSDVCISSESLVEECDEASTWNYDGAELSYSLQTKEQETMPIQLELRNTKIELTSLALELSSLYFELVADGFPPVKIYIPEYLLPDITFPLFGGLNAQNEEYSLSLDSETRYAALQLEPVSIEVRIPIDWLSIGIGLIGIAAVVILVIGVISMKR